MAGLLVLVMVWAIGDAMFAETFSLRKDSWVCGKSHTETFHTVVLVGNVQIPQIQTQTVCDQWERKR